MRLSKLTVGAKGIIRAIEGVSPTTLRLMEMGFTTGSAVELVRRAPFGDPIEVRIHNTRICLRLADADSFDIESAAGEAGTPSTTSGAT
jgi:Fe2+ transport system protein FeoA